MTGDIHKPRSPVRVLFCPKCEDYRPVRHKTRQQTYTVRDREITIPVGVDVCVICGEEIGSDEQDKRIIEMLHDHE